MQIKYLGKEKFEIKTKEVKLDLGYTIAINDFALPGPGEYEKSGIFVEGVADNGNTIYVIKAEEMNLCYLGKLAHTLSEDEAKEIGDIDILFVPLGEDGSLPTKKALSVVSSIDPKIVIPMLYADLEEFKKSEGITDGEQDVFKVRKIDLPTDQRQNVILNS
jgi:L-ascorbate metabolism protein UlaG (beta-lactamase superfamily)